MTPQGDATHDLIRKLERKHGFWAIVLAFSVLAGLSGYFLPSDSPFLIVALAGVCVFPVAFFLERRFRIRHELELRRSEVSEIRRDGTLPAPSEPPVPAPEQGAGTEAAPLAPVLYLRSFEDDPVAARLRGGLTEEEHLVRLLGHFGQVVGIGRPSDVARYVGAQRAYLGYVDWQGTIEDLMRSARLVVVRTGITPGLLWEVGKAVETLSPDRLLLVVDSAPELAALLDVIRSRHPGTPARLRLGWRRAGSIRGFVTFRDDWVPEMLPVRSSAVWLHGQKTAETYVDIRLARTLRPVFLRLGVAWPRPPVSWEALATFAMLGATVAAIVVLWLLASLGLISG